MTDSGTGFLDLAELPRRWRQHAALHQLGVVQVAYGAPLFEAIVGLRAEVLGSAYAEDAVDRYASLWLIEHRGEPVASLRTTRRRDGPLDCEPYLPPKLLATFRDVLGSTDRLCCSPSLPSAIRAVPLLIELAWHKALQGGVRLDIVGVDSERATLQQRLGYLPIPGSGFQSPRDGRPCHVMFLPTDPDHLGPLSDVFAGWPGPVTVADVRATLRDTTRTPADTEGRRRSSQRRFPIVAHRLRRRRA